LDCRLQQWLPTQLNILKVDITVECNSLEWHHHIWVAVLIAFLLDITINQRNDHKGGDLINLVGKDEEQPLGDEKEMM